jgi:thiol-disulfide isomerase/thioredoxin
MRHSTLLLFLVLGWLSASNAAIAQGRDTKGEKPLSIAQGQTVDITHFLVKNRITIFDFKSDYCEPCRAYDEPLYLLHQKKINLAVVKVDINRPEIHRIDWESPVAVQYNIRALPYFKVYNAEGKLVAEGQDARYLVDQWLASLE